MRRTTKIAALAALPVSIASAAVALTATASNAATTPSAPNWDGNLDNSAYVSNTAGCTPGVTTHTDYKWVPNVSNAGPTMWTVKNADPNTPATFTWKGGQVAYHRDGTKTQPATDTLCGVAEPLTTYDGKCSVTIPYVPGIDTRLYGVNGHPETAPITEDVTVSAGLDGSDNTAPQFWVGYTARPGYVITNPGAAVTHVDFYSSGQCNVVITSQAQADALSGTKINTNVDVPAGVTRPDGSPIWLSWAHITGNLTVEGNLFMSADTVDGNATVSGDGSFLGLSNYASHFAKDLNVQNSSGIYTGGPGTTSFGNWTQYNGASQVDGNVNFINNSGGLYSGYPMHVNGTLTYNGNTGPVLDHGGLTAGSTVSDSRDFQ